MNAYAALAGVVATVAAMAGSAWWGYDYRDARAGREAAAAVQDARETEERLHEGYEDIGREARAEAARQRLLRAAGDAERAGLRQRYRAQLESAVAAAAAGGAGAGDAIGVLADVLDRAEARADAIAAFADARGIARLTCERAYERARAESLR